MPEKGFVRLREKVPYQGKGLEQLLGFLRQTLSQPDNKYAQKITLEVGVPYVRIEKLVPEAQAEDVPQLSLHDAVRAKPIEEFKPEPKQSPMHQVWSMFEIIHAEGLEASHVLVGDKHAFQSWLKVRIPITKLTIFGVPIRIIPQYPSDVFVICGALTKEAEADEVQFSVKGTCS